MQKSFLTNEGKKAEMKVVCNKWGSVENQWG